MSAPRRPVGGSLGAALCSAGAAATFLLLATVLAIPMAQPVLLAAAALTGVLAYRVAR